MSVRALALAICSAGVRLWSAPDKPVSFKSDVAPILEKNCVTCHGPAQQLSLLDLSSRAAALKGGQKGPAIIPGDADRSLRSLTADHGRVRFHEVSVRKFSLAYATT